MAVVANSNKSYFAIHSLRKATNDSLQKEIIMQRKSHNFNAMNALKKAIYLYG